MYMHNICAYIFLLPSLQKFVSYYDVISYMKFTCPQLCIIIIIKYVKFILFTHLNALNHLNMAQSHRGVEAIMNTYLLNIHNSNYKGENNNNIKSIINNNNNNNNN